jgi:hypothetical protein
LLSAIRSEKEMAKVMEMEREIEMERGETKIA